MDQHFIQEEVLCSRLLQAAETGPIPGLMIHYPVQSIRWDKGHVVGHVFTWYVDSKYITNK